MRGTVSNELYRQAVRAFARVTGAAPEAVEAKVLYAGSREDRNVMLLQAWTRGEDARTFGYLDAAGNETTWLGQFTAPVPAALALLVLDGDGDPDRPIYRGTVADLLATF